MATRINLVTVLRRKTSYFSDETYSRHHFPVKNARFWRRESISSPFCGKKCPILATSLDLVTFFGRKTSYFGDET
ncbi:hypothetical protein NSQ96_18140 [Caldifermentibacillus hisashii]|uniref:hypothetical protein n=1 Tax=Caldifermentibacillus hisashii TaxID=996558 RepID=UPI0031FD5AD2